MTIQRLTLLLCGVFSAWVLISPAPVTANENRDEKAKTREVFASLWKLSEQASEQDYHLKLTTLGQSTPVSTFLTSTTRIEGECTHCQIALQCTVGELGKRCPVCPCGFTNVQCFTNQKSEKPGLAPLLQSLPYGTQLRVEFVTPEHPEEGVKRLIVDRLGALLTVEGLDHVTSTQLQALERAVGAKNATLNSTNDQLQLSLKDTWTAAKASRLEKELEKLGCKVLTTSAEQSAN